MIMNPKLTFCVAVGPYEEFNSLKLTLDSILNQEFANYEIIIKIYNDIILDRINEYVLNFNNNKIIVISGEDLGIYDALNIGIKNSNGEYIMILGCGDRLYDKNTVRCLNAFIVKNKNPIILYGIVELYSEGMQSHYFSNKCFLGYKKLTPWRNPCHSQGLVYKKSWIIDKPFKIDVGPLADLIHTYQYKVHKNCLYINTPIARFFEGGVSNKTDYKAFTKCRRSVLINCNNFHYSYLWKPLAFVIYSLHYFYRLSKYQ